MNLSWTVSPARNLSYDHSILSIIFFLFSSPFLLHSLFFIFISFIYLSSFSWSYFVFFCLTLISHLSFSYFIAVFVQFLYFSSFFPPLLFLISLPHPTQKLSFLPRHSHSKYTHFTRYSFSENTLKDTKESDVTEVTFEPKLCTFEEEINNEMGIKEDRKPAKTYWY